MTDSYAAQRVNIYINKHLRKKINEVASEIGAPSFSAFIRQAVQEKIKRHKHAAYMRACRAGRAVVDR